EVTTSTAERLASSGSLSIGCSSDEAFARSVRIWVIWSAKGFASATRAWALVICEVAISSWALVIFLVELTDLIRSRSSRMFAMASDHTPLGLESDACHGPAL